MRTLDERREYSLKGYATLSSRQTLSCRSHVEVFLGAGLGYALGVKNSFMMSIEYYTGIDERLAMPIVLPPVPNWTYLGRWFLLRTMSLTLVTL